MTSRLRCPEKYCTWYAETDHATASNAKFIAALTQHATESGHMTPEQVAAISAAASDQSVLDKGEATA